MSLIIQDGSFGGSTNRVMTLTQYYAQRKMNIPFVTGTTTARASAGTSRTITVGAGHGLEMGDIITVLGMGNANYNSVVAYRMFPITAVAATTVTYTYGTSLTEAETPDTGGRWSCSKWKTLRVGIRCVVTGDADITNNNIYFGINTGTGTPTTSNSCVKAIGVKYSANPAGYNAVNKWYVDTGTLSKAYCKQGATLTTTDLSASYTSIILSGDTTKPTCLFLRIHKSAANLYPIITMEHHATAPLTNMTQAQFKACLGYTSNAALAPLYAPGATVVTAAETWEDPLLGIWDTFEICWGPGSNPLNILDMGWAIVER